MYIADFSFCAFQRRYVNKSWDHALLLTGLDLYTAPDSDLGKCRPCKFSLKNKKSWDHALLLTARFETVHCARLRSWKIGSLRIFQKITHKSC